MSKAVLLLLDINLIQRIEIWKEDQLLKVLAAYFWPRL